MGMTHHTETVGYLTGNPEDGYRVSSASSVEYDSIEFGGVGIGYMAWLNLDTGPEFVKTCDSLMDAVKAILGGPQGRSTYRFATRGAY